MKKRGHKIVNENLMKTALTLTENGVTSPAILSKVLKVSIATVSRMVRSGFNMHKYEEQARKNASDWAEKYSPKKEVKSRTSDYSEVVDLLKTIIAILEQLVNRGSNEEPIGEIRDEIN